MYVEGPGTKIMIFKLKSCLTAANHGLLEPKKRISLKNPFFHGFGTVCDEIASKIDVLVYMFSGVNAIRLSRQARNAKIMIFHQKFQNHIAYLKMFLRSRRII